MAGCYKAVAALDGPHAGGAFTLWDGFISTYSVETSMHITMSSAVEDINEMYQDSVFCRAVRLN